MILNWEKPVVAVIAAAIVIGLVYRGGQKSCEKDHLVAAQKQELAAREKEKQNDQNTLAVAQTYSDELARLNRALKRMSNKPSGTPVSSPANSPSPADGTNGERDRACQGTGFYANALNCELKLKGFREFVILQGLPVK